MSYRGYIKGGVVVFDGDVNLPDGTLVQVELMPGVRQPTVWQKLLALAGTADGLPQDAAENLDHYLYGTPKR